MSENPLRSPPPKANITPERSPPRSWYKAWKTHSTKQSSPLIIMGGPDEKPVFDKLLTGFDELKMKMENIVSDRETARLEIERLQFELRSKFCQETELQELRKKVPELELRLQNEIHRVAVAMLRNEMLEEKLKKKSNDLKELQNEMNEKNENVLLTVASLNEENQAAVKEVECQLRKEMDERVAESETKFVEQKVELERQLSRKTEELSDVRKSYEKQLLRLEEQNSDLLNVKKDLDRKLFNEKRNHQVRLQKMVEGDFETQQRWMLEEENMRGENASLRREFEKLRQERAQDSKIIRSLQKENHNLKNPRDQDVEKGSTTPQKASSGQPTKPLLSALGREPQANGNSVKAKLPPCKPPRKNASTLQRTLCQLRRGMTAKAAA